MFLIADPMPADEVDYFEVDIDGAMVRSDAQRDGNRARLHHELADIAMGSHTIKVRAVNEWGGGDWSDPFVFDVQLPGKVSGLGLSEE